MQTTSHTPSIGSALARALVSLATLAALALHCPSLCAQAALPNLEGLTGAVIDESGITNVYYVRQSGGSDSNNGKSFSAAFQTLNKGVFTALQDVRNGIRTRVLVYNGTYRESLNPIDFQSGPGLTTLMVIEGAPGQTQVVLSGSDVWNSGWTTHSGDIRKRPFTLNWGFSYVDWNAGDIAKRRELMFLNGQPLLPRIIRSSAGVRTAPGTALQKGTFGVDDHPDFREIYVNPHDGVDFASATKEVTVRTQALRFTRKENLVLRNLTIQHYAGWYWHPWGHNPVVHFADNSKNILLDNIRFRWNSGTATRIPANMQGMTIRNCQFHYTGHTGLSAANGSSNILVEDSSFNWNNWRGYMGGDINWWTGGAKVGGFMDVVAFRRCQFIGNMTSGLWFDVHARNTELSDILSVYNHLNGLFLEISRGPFLVTRSLFAYNGRNDILQYTVRDCTIERTIVFGHSRGGTAYDGLNYKFLTRAGDYHWELDPFTPGGVTTRDSIIAGNAQKEHIVAFENNHTVSPGYMSVYRAQNNTYYHGSGSSTNRFRYGSWGSTTGNFDGWKSFFGWRETGALWRDPRFEDPELLDFRFRSDSPFKSVESQYLAVEVDPLALYRTQQFFDWLGYTEAGRINLRPVPGAHWYRINPKNTWRVLEVAHPGTATGANAHLRNDWSGPAMTWRVHSAGGGYLQFQPRSCFEASKWAGLEVQWPGTAAGSNARLNDFNAGTWQQFRLVHIGGGHFVLQPRSCHEAGHWRGLGAAGTADYSNVELQNLANPVGNLQQWRFDVPTKISAW